MLVLKAMLSAFLLGFYKACQSSSHMWGGETEAQGSMPLSQGAEPSYKH